MITRDSRFRLIEGNNLQIENVKPHDAGDYNCQVDDQENRDLVHTVEILGKFEQHFILFQNKLPSMVWHNISNYRKIN